MIAECKRLIDKGAALHPTTRDERNGAKRGRPISCLLPSAKPLGDRAGDQLASHLPANLIRLLRIVRQELDEADAHLIRLFARRG